MAVDPTMKEQLTTIFNEARMVLDSIDVAQDQIRFFDVADDELRALNWHNGEGFAHEKRSFRQLGIPFSGFSELARRVSAEPGPVHFLFFMPFSCSTLFTRATEVLTGCFSLREPNLGFLVGNGSDDPRIDPVSSILLSRAPDDAPFVLIKPTGLGLVAARRLMRIFPASRAVCLYSGFDEFFAQVVKPVSGQNRARFIMNSVHGYLRQPENQPFTLSKAEITGNSLEEAIAYYWLDIKLRFLELLAEEEGRVWSLSSDELLSRQEDALSSICEVYESPARASVAEVRKVVFSSHAKAKSDKLFSGGDRSGDISQALERNAVGFQNACNWFERHGLSEWRDSQFPRALLAGR